jgi:hypothetical protein
MVGTTGYRSPRDVTGALGFDPPYRMRGEKSSEAKPIDRIVRFGGFNRFRNGAYGQR